MDVNEALRIAAMRFRTQSRGAGRDTDTLLELANNVDIAREQLRNAKADLDLLREVMRIEGDGGEFSLMKYSDGWMAGSPSRRTGRWEYAKRKTPQAALKDALDAAGVPAAKGGG